MCKYIHICLCVYNFKKIDFVNILFDLFDMHRSLASKDNTCISQFASWEIITAVVYIQYLRNTYSEKTSSLR